MTAMLKNIRELDAQLKRGEITPAEHAKRREILLQSSEIIDTDFLGNRVFCKVPGGSLA